MRLIACILLLAVFPATPALAQEIDVAPTRDEGDGPFERLVLRGGTLIDGTCAPPIGP